MTRSRVLIVHAFAAVYLIWGSTYLAIRYAIETLPSFLMAASRFLTAGLILFVWALGKGELRVQQLMRSTNYDLRHGTNKGPD